MHNSRLAIHLNNLFIPTLKYFRMIWNVYYLHNGTMLVMCHRQKKPGDYISYEIADESIIIVQGDDNKLRAFFNVCRHRGSRICLDKCGTVKRLVCPYHAWAYDLEGILVSARNMPDDFDSSKYGLHHCQVEILDGLIFICLANENTQDFEEIKHALLPYLKPYQLQRTKVAHSKTYTVHANWKLAIENYIECYHCAHLHPEFTQVANSHVLSAASDLSEHWTYLKKLFYH